MPTSTQRARYEAALVGAARIIRRAAEAASEMGDESAEQDLTEIGHHLSAMCRESLNGKRHRPALLPAQQSLC